MSEPVSFGREHLSRSLLSESEGIVMILYRSEYDWDVVATKQHSRRAGGARSPWQTTVPRLDGLWGAVRCCNNIAFPCCQHAVWLELYGKYGAIQET